MSEFWTKQVLKDLLRLGHVILIVPLLVLLHFRLLLALLELGVASYFTYAANLTSCETFLHAGQPGIGARRSRTRRSGSGGSPTSAASSFVST
eukprot:1115836-Heterocapsa_arctica.AAC.1